MPHGTTHRSIESRTLAGSSRSKWPKSQLRPHRRLDDLINNPSNGKRNPVTGIDGDWRDTALQHIYEAYNQNAEEAGLMFGRIFKWIVINRPESLGWVSQR